MMFSSLNPQSCFRWSQEGCEKGLCIREQTERLAVQMSSVADRGTLKRIGGF